MTLKDAKLALRDAMLSVDPKCESAESPNGMFYPEQRGELFDIYIRVVDHLFDKFRAAIQKKFGKRLGEIVRVP